MNISHLFSEVSIQRCSNLVWLLLWIELIISFVQNFSIGFLVYKNHSNNVNSFIFNCVCKFINLEPTHNIEYNNNE